MDEFKKRIESGRWPIYKQTRYQTLFEIGDQVIFYLAGREGSIFVGDAKIASKVNKGDAKLVFSVDISDAVVWKNPRSIRNLIENLGFIRDKTNWGLSMQGGVLKINEKDFKTIISKTR